MRRKSSQNTELQGFVFCRRKLCKDKIDSIIVEIFLVMKKIFPRNWKTFFCRFLNIAHFSKPGRRSRRADASRGKSERIVKRRFAAPRRARSRQARNKRYSARCYGFMPMRLLRILLILCDWDKLIWSVGILNCNYIIIEHLKSTADFSNYKICSSFGSLSIIPRKTA